jgi:hypothetical protein
VGVLYGAYLRNFRKMGNDLLEAYEFDVLDGKGESVKTIFVYDGVIPALVRQPLISDRKESMEFALNAPRDVTFNVMFEAMDRKYRVGGFLGIGGKERGYRLNALSIKPDKGSGGGNKKDLPTPYVIM